MTPSDSDYDRPDPDNPVEAAGQRLDSILQDYFERTDRLASDADTPDGFCGVTLTIGIGIDSDTIASAFAASDRDDIIAALADPDNKDFHNWVKALLIGGANAELASTVFNTTYKPKLLGVGVTHDTTRTRYGQVTDGMVECLGMTEKEAMAKVTALARRVIEQVTQGNMGVDPNTTPAATVTDVPKPWGPIG